MKNILKGIADKFSETTGGVHNSLYTAVSGRMYYGLAPEDAVSPYVVYGDVVTTPSYTFSESFEEMLVQFTVAQRIPEKRSSAVSLLTIVGYLHSLYDWNFSLTISGYTEISMRRIATRRFKNKDFEYYTIDYRVYVQKT